MGLSLSHSCRLIADGFDSIATPGYAVSNLLMGLSLLVCSYNFFRAITLDPGHIPFATNDMELKEVSCLRSDYTRKRMLTLT